MIIVAEHDERVLGTGIEDVHIGPLLVRRDHPEMVLGAPEATQDIVESPPFHFVVVQPGLKPGTDQGSLPAIAPGPPASKLAMFTLEGDVLVHGPLWMALLPDYQLHPIDTKAEELELDKFARSTDVHVLATVELVQAEGLRTETVVPTP